MSLAGTENFTGGFATPAFGASIYDASKMRKDGRAGSMPGKSMGCTPGGKLSAMSLVPEKPDARSMATSGKDTGIVGYNVQAAVDTRNHLIVAHEVTNIGSDRHQLHTMAESGILKCCGPAKRTFDNRKTNQK